MINDKTVLIIIPARGGSKGLPRKNVRELCSKPLIAWSIEQACNSHHADTVVVSTDDDEIAEVSKIYGADVPFTRPAELATDTATSFDVVKHCIDFYRIEKKLDFDIIALIEPTSPLRELSDIDTMLEKLVLNYNSGDSIISIGQIAEHPSIVKIINGNLIKAYVEDLPMTMRRQDQVPSYFPYGVAYIAKKDVLLKEKTFYTNRSLYHLIKRYQCYEIDDIYDFITIENIMRYEWKLN